MHGVRIHGAGARGFLVVVSLRISVCVSRGKKNWRQDEEIPEVSCEKESMVAILFIFLFPSFFFSRSVFPSLPTISNRFCA